MPDAPAAQRGPPQCSRVNESLASRSRAANCVDAATSSEPALSDGVVALRPWGEDDVAVKVAWGQDRGIVRWTGVPADQTEETSRAHAVHTEEARRAGRMVALAIVQSSCDAVVGSCDIRLPDATDPAVGELGYLLAAKARGQGFAARAIWLLTDWGFRQLGMERIQALVHPENPTSARVLDRLGFQREGLLRRYRQAITDARTACSTPSCLTSSRQSHLALARERFAAEVRPISTYRVTILTENGTLADGRSLSSYGTRSQAKSSQT